MKTNQFLLIALAAVVSFNLNIDQQGIGSNQAQAMNNLCLPQKSGEKVDMACIEEQLTSTGIGGWVHASVKDQQLLVFTWRRPNNFFVNVQLPMSSKDPAVLEALLKLRRHDQIVVKGEFYKNEAPIPHINVTGIKVVKAYDGPQETFQYDEQLPTQILKNKVMIGKVHIVANGGSVLVVEVADRVIPVFNAKPELAKALFRNDKIQIAYNVELLPFRPAHLSLDVNAAEPIKVLEEIAEGHGETITLSGPLVMFPKSPQIKFNVFALRTEDTDRVSRNYTIINFADFDLFTAIREKLQEAWTHAEASAEYDRNKYVNRRIMVTVTGSKNVISADQANPQVVPSQMSDVKIEFLK